MLAPRSVPLRRPWWATVLALAGKVSLAMTARSQPPGNAPARPIGAAASGSFVPSRAVVILWTGHYTDLAPQVSDVVGVNVQPINIWAAGQSEPYPGLRSTAVYPGSAAAQAGLEPDDLIILVHDRPVATVDRLRAAPAASGGLVHLSVINALTAVFTALIAVLSSGLVHARYSSSGRGYPGSGPYVSWRAGGASCCATTSGKWSDSCD